MTSVQWHLTYFLKLGLFRPWSRDQEGTFNVEKLPSANISQRYGHSYVTKILLMQYDEDSVVEHFEDVHRGAWRVKFIVVM